MTSLQLDVEDEERRERLAFTKERITFGRSAGNDVVVDDAQVSRTHCVLERNGDGFRVVDLGSQNGTFVNGDRVPQARLKAGDAIRIGRLKIKVVAVDVSGAEDVDELQKDRAFLNWLVTVNRDLAAEHELMPLLNRVLDAVVSFSRAERAFVVLASKDGGLECEASRNFQGDAVHDAEVAVSRSIAHEVLESGKPLFSINAREDERFRAVQSIVNLGLRSVLCVPIRFRDELLGVVYIDNRLEAGVFSTRDAERLLVFADQAAIAVANARMIRELVDSNEALATARARLELLNRDLRRTVSDREAELASVRARLAGDDIDEPESKYDSVGIIGRSPAMTRVFEMLDRVTDSNFPVLVEGESGTGKELVARAIHRLGQRRSEPFVSENCAALPETLLESELFGSIKGAFTGASATRRGLVERAHRGTLFLDEVSEMSPALQAKMLRFLQEGEFRPVGGTDPIKVDVRIVSASNKDLRQMVTEGKFREDLFYRLNVLPVRLPPLRSRADDIPLLLERFVARAATAQGRKMPRIAPEVVEACKRYPWPGNVRELENEVRRLVTLCDDVLVAERLSAHVLEGRAGANDAKFAAVDDDADLSARVASIEMREIQKALKDCNGNKSRAATQLGISRFSLNRKIEKYGLEKTE
jgi:transcriptional regulator with GAF, ATPase, and Fis domain